MRGLERYVICDLDGCIADDRWRRCQIPPNPQGPEDWDMYHRLCATDSEVHYVLQDVMADCLDENGKQTALLLIVTSRPDRWDIKATTIAWLDEVLTVEYVLLMRPPLCTLGSVALKMNLINELFEGRHEVAAHGWTRVIRAYDDRQDILDAYPLCRAMRCRRNVEDE